LLDNPHANDNLSFLYCLARFIDCIWSLYLQYICLVFGDISLIKIRKIWMAQWMAKKERERPLKSWIDTVIDWTHGGRNTGTRHISMERTRSWPKWSTDHGM